MLKDIDEELEHYKEMKRINIFRSLYDIDEKRIRKLKEFLEYYGNYNIK